MEARLFNKQKDIAMIKEWYLDRGYILDKTSRIPELGVIVDEIAVCFIYHDKTSSIGFIHGLISNPRQSKKKVYQAISKMLDLGKIETKKRGMEIVLLFTHYRSLMRLASRKKFIATTNLVEMLGEL